MRICFFLFTAILALHSCGLVENKFGRLPEGSTTTANFVFDRHGDFSTQALELYGGIAIYLVGTNGNGFSTNLWLPNKFERRDITVPNGSYRIYAVGWEGDNSGPCSAPTPCSPLQGQVRCSDPNMPAVNMTGGVTNVALNMSTAHCDFTNNTVYALGMASATDFKSMGVYYCDPSSSPFPSNCATPTSKDISMELVIYQKVNGQIRINEQETRVVGCAGSINNGGTVVAKNFPVGNPSHPHRPFVVRFRLYGSSTSCSGAVLGEYLFGEGLAAYAMAPGAANTYFDYINGGWGGQSVLKLK